MTLISRWLSIIWLVVILTGSLLSYCLHPAGVPMSDEVLAGVSENFLLGSDSLGRSLLWMTMRGSAWSLAVGLLALSGAALIALVLGALVGILGGLFDRLYLRASEVMLALPGLLWAMGFVYLLRASWGEGAVKDFVALVFALSLTSWMTMSRILRSQVKTALQQGYVEAARALGAKPQYIFLEHIFPQVRLVWLGYIFLQLPNFLMMESFLSFVGMGAQSPQTSWGLLVKEGWKFLSTHPLQALVPASFLFLTVLSIRSLFYSIKKGSEEHLHSL